AARYPSLCFGSCRLFNAQHHLKANGYASHEAWRDDWRAARSAQFMVIGSNDEAGGNKTCRARIGEDGCVDLDLYLGADRGHVAFDGLRLPHGHAAWLAAITAADAECALSLAWQKQTARDAAGLDGACLAAFRKERTARRRAQPKLGHALTDRFVKDGYGWRIVVTVTKEQTRLRPDFARGAMGLDLNDQHVSRTRVGADGGLLDSRDLALVTCGKSNGQRLARMHDVAHALVQEAHHLHVPVVIEKLDFAAKKRRLREVGCVADARRLSSFAYAR
ncbi:MAG: hypothetical protein J2P53_18405, partial [Bradyrhizobiaceae bacterium]|nr:hypothetical protein [Bradyrhizobiaceae bacterium]